MPQANKKLFYILDCRAKYIEQDKWLIFWRHENSGYCWFKNWAGLQDEEQAVKTIGRHEELKAINSYEIEDMWIPTRYNGKWRLVIENNRENRARLGIKIS